MKIERRDVTSAEVRTSESDPGLFEAVVLQYGVVDSYNTVFDAGCFRDSLEERMPRITWGHDWTDVIGRYVDYKDDATSLTLVGQLDMETLANGNPVVPRAHQAHAQLRSGTITDFSVGFHRKPDGVVTDDDNREHFTRAGLDEAALVLSGAVPGTKLVSVRSLEGQRRQVPEELVVDLGKKIASGDLTLAEVDAILKLVSGEVGEVPVIGAKAEEEEEVPLVLDPIESDAEALWVP